MEILTIERKSPKNDILQAPVKDFEYDEQRGLYRSLDITFVNTNEFIKTRKRFEKEGAYTKAHPKYDRREFFEFWREERRRRIEGYSVGGVRITGEHYGFLNYGQILLTPDPDDTKEVVKTQRGTRKKEVAFPDFWNGHYKWFKAKEFARSQGLHIIGGKARRKGYSYIGGWGAANVVDLYPGMTVLLGAFDTAYLTKGDGIATMAKNYLDLLSKNTAWKKKRLINTKEHIKLGYKLRGRDEEYGFKSQIVAVSFQNNPDAAIGKDAYEIYLEEVGKFPNFLESLDVTLPTLEDGIHITGQIVAWGTGGTKGANWEAFEKVFYNPKSYGFMGFDNVWDDGMKGTQCGFFFPHIQNLKGFIDKNGNSNLVEAQKYSDKKREEHKNNTTDVHSHNIWTGQRANKPGEAFSRSISNIFSSPELGLHIQKVAIDTNIKYLHRAGQLIRDESGVKFIGNDVIEGLGHKVHPPIFEYPHNPAGDCHGCFVEWFSPFKINGKIPEGLYRIWVDPVAFDKNEDQLSVKDSLASCYVYERTNKYTNHKGDILVASFVGRTPKNDTFNEIVIRIAEYYGGYDQCILFENDRGTLKEYATKERKLHLLCDEPDIYWKKELQSRRTGREKGIMINEKRKNTGAIYFKDWLYTIRGTDQHGNKKFNFQYIYDIALLKQIEKWNLKGNFDRVSACIVGMYDIQEQFDKEIRVISKGTGTSFFERNLFTR